LGFRYATKAGVSISVEDLTIPPAKKAMLASAEQLIRETEARYAKGEITEVERFQKVIILGTPRPKNSRTRWFVIFAKPIRSTPST